MGYEHPLDPLSGEEIRACTAACKQAALQRKLSATLRFNAITAQEPPKKQLVAYDSGTGPCPPRRAFCILQAWPKADVVEAVVDLSRGRGQVISWKELHGVQALFHPDDCFMAEDIAKKDPEVQRKLREEYGITDLSLVACDPWSVHGTPVPGRLIQLWMYKRSSPHDNHYAHPIEFVPFVDLNLRKVVHWELPHSVNPGVPERDVNYHHTLMEQPWRSGLKPLNVVQPQGPSWTMEGNLIKWQKWHIRLGWNYREGVVLHNVGYEDQGRVRPILHRGSLVEMAVPYGDVNEPFQRKCAFDVGDYGLGYCANSLELGCDCLGHIQYFDGVLNDTKGEPMVIKKAVCMHEEDAGILFKHMEYRDGSAEVRRSRRLVISFISTVVNYEYAFYWSFYQDGTIDYQIKLTGELSTNALSQHELAMGKGTYGTIVAPGVNAQNHQHMFCARLDFALDCEQGGRPLIVTETNTERMPVEENPFGNGFRGVERELRTELQAKRTADPLVGRTWKVKNPARINPITRTPVGYKLMSTASPLILALPGSLLAKRGEFATANLWVTPHQDDERWPAGDYPAQHTGGQGLGKWTKQNRTVSGQDPVVWHAFGVLHYPRIEDFPIMPVEVTGFTLKPVNFFSGNPGIDIPPERNNASKAECCKEVSIANGNGGSSSKL